MKLFVVTPPGIETFTAEEIDQTPSSKAERAVSPGGIEFSGELTDIYRLNLRLRTATRILVRVGDFDVTSFAELRRKCRNLEWGAFLRPGQPVTFRITCHHSRLYHTSAIAERIAGAIGDRLKVPPEVLPAAQSEDSPSAQLIVVRIENDHCTLSLDTSGEALNRRGYRQATAKAPLRETLAAGMILASGWDGRSPFIDPFCGSGTLPIEAALIARKIAPGLKRDFQFMKWPVFKPTDWNWFHEEARVQSVPSEAPIFASDRDAGAIEMAKANAARAGVLESIQFEHKALSAIQILPKPGWLVSNPPYGVRVRSNQDLRNLYAQLGNILRARGQGWRLALLCSDDGLLNAVQIPLNRSISLNNGGIPVRLARGQVGAAQP